ncbi:MAG: NADH-quinone oxidoreductase subunit L [Pirellulales bacterium]
MNLDVLLPKLLCIAWLLPLASFTLIVLFGPKMGRKGVLASYVATGAISGSFVLSLVAFLSWLGGHGTAAPGGHHGADHHGDDHAAVAPALQNDATSPFRLTAAETHSDSHGHDDHAEEHAPHKPVAYTGTWYTLGSFGDLQVTVSYYIDALTVCMFTMVTLIATCIHFYAIGYMHDELHDITDHEVLVTKGYKIGGHGHAAHGHDDHGHGIRPTTFTATHTTIMPKRTARDQHPGPAGFDYLHRPGRFYRFFQYLSLFCFSMLGLVIAGNIAMVFVFWELVGICSYFLIGFYIERKSASNAANKAFIVNRVGDFGMIIGLMALWGSLGTFAFGDVDGKQGLFSQVRNPAHHYELRTPDGMVVSAAKTQIENGVEPSAAQIEKWRSDKLGYWLLVIAGLGIFCGCVGKSAQFPLHVWLPDAMEGPTPVSALVHSATMVAAGVYLVGRFYPMFTPEVLLVIAYVGLITLFIAATIAITATDIKRVLAYSTVSQLGYMMLALGIGGWAAGLFHLITHAFFKSLLFMCSGSVIHACHTNDMFRMGGLRKKMPWTAYTMLVGCLAIIGTPLFSGFYSKDAIVAQALTFTQMNPAHGILLYGFAAGAAMTAFYMFRLWFLTFAGKPRDHHVNDHVHESPKIMYVPLVILSVFAVGVGWTVPFAGLSISNLLEQARPAGELGTGVLLPALSYPNEHDSHAPAIHAMATLIASATAAGGFILALVFYGLRKLDAADVKRQFSPIYYFLVNKWYFDELYNFIFIKPTHFLSGIVARFDKNVIDVLIDKLAVGVKSLSKIDDLIDRTVVDGFVNVVGNWTYAAGRSLKTVQTGKIRQYVLFIVVGTAALTVVMQWALAGQ